MCGRFTLSLSAEELKAALDVDVWEDEDAYMPSWNTAPGMETPVFYDAGRAALSMMKWGIASSSLFKSPEERNIINIRRETFLSSLSSSKRCIVPADGYYEWAKKGSLSVPYYFAPAGPLIIFFAGLWYGEKGKRAFAVLTTEAVGEAAAIHSRAPVIFGKGMIERWIGASARETLKEILDEASACPPEMKFRTVSGKVNGVSLNSPECIREFKYKEQPDLF